MSESALEDETLEQLRQKRIQEEILKKREQEAKQKNKIYNRIGRMLSEL